jgi:hypothetical protein
MTLREQAEYLYLLAYLIEFQSLRLKASCNGADPFTRSEEEHDIYRHYFSEDNPPHMVNPMPWIQLQSFSRIFELLTIHNKEKSWFGVHYAVVAISLMVCFSIV